MEEHDMVITDVHAVLMDTPEAHEHIGEFADLRRPHLSNLKDVETLIRKHSPLPLTFDVNRQQPPYFFEFTYAECMGGVLLTPQSAEAAARLVDYASKTKHELDFDAMPTIMDRLETSGTLDKYNLGAPTVPEARKVVFLPGSNLFEKMISREILTRIMIEDEDVFIKPHPMTSEEHIRTLGRNFGYHRIIPHRESGWRYLKQAETVYSASTTELAIYARLLDKPVVNISNVFQECYGTYFPLFRLPSKEALIQALASPYSGFFSYGDPSLEKRVAVYFEEAMKMRDFLKPMVFEFDAPVWAQAKAHNGTVK